MTTKRRLTSLLLTACTVGLSACGALRTWEASSPRYDSPGSSQPALQDQEELRELARRFGLMALFSKVVYREDLPLVPEDRRTGAGCNYLGTKNADPLSYGMPRDENGQWQRWTEVSNPESPPCMDKDGLYYETYVHLNREGKLDEAVIAFRGTENSRSQILKDWTTNLAAAFGFEPSEFKLARLAMPGLVKALEARFAQDQNPPIIYATGHSLGGGLAQQLAYMSRSVKAAITFNTSPVTNWSSLRFEPGAIGNDYPTIYRLEHGGEFLSFPRYVATAATKARFGRYDIVLQIDDRSWIGGHAIGIFACRFAELVAKGGSLTAEHYYPRAYAQHILTLALDKNGPPDGDRAICKEQAHLINQRPKVDGSEQRER